MENVEIWDKLFYILVNIVLVTFINFIFNRKLKKQTVRFSLYNEIQIHSLKKIYKLLTTFKFISIQIKENNKRGFDYYKKNSDKWLLCFFRLTSTLSQEKYILPKEIKKSYADTIKELNSLRDYLIDNTNLKDNFETHFDGLEYNQVIKPYADEDYIRELLGKIQNIKSDDLFKTVNEKVEILRNKIELEFEKMK
ncbi:hypothetical protein [Polaribacter sp. Hel1_33_49]|jgi:hypothetical protein|uniref:hypothetical protein n=1 Tax=Polaribacter sp. Hel1_33_49 TaxID=1336803 RepID=UPI000566045F|nr:hypothetical protein [Polaribacter sp. Hel1_33_49]